MSDTSKAVFLSYASQDAEAARRICEALRAAGIEVWFDQRELRGGDTWDAKIRKQIKECALFVPVISANTQARHEGYFRLEWRLADQRTHLMGKSRAFLVPVCIDDTRDTDADVPDSFVAVHWTRLRPAGYDGQALPGTILAAFCERVKALLQGGEEEVARAFEHVGADGGADSTRSKARATAGRSPHRRWIMAASATAVIATVAIWQPWKKVASASAGTAPPTEARKLVLQAKALLDDDPLLVRESFLAAERFSLRAIELDPTDGEAWAVAARAGTVLARDYQDRSPVRAEAVRSRVETAIRLAPDSIESGLARASYDFEHSVGRQAALDRLEALAERAPADRRILEMATRLVYRTSLSESAAGPPGERWAARADALPGGSAVAFSERARYHWVLSDLPAMEAAVNRSLAIRPTSQGYYWKLVLLVWGWGEFDAARAVLKTLPASLLQEDHFVLLAYHAELWSGNFDAAVAALKRTRRPFLEEFAIFYSRGFLMGEALAYGGKARAAEIERRNALKAVEERMALEPNSGGLMLWKARILAALGEKEPARQAFEAAEELGARGTRWTNALEVERHVIFGRIEEAVAAAEKMLDRTKRRWPLALNELRFEPALAPLRSHPRIQTLISTAQGWLAELRASSSARPASTSSVAVPDASNSKLQTQYSKPTDLPSGKSVAVLAFANRSDDKGSEYFSDGISEEIANVLGRVPGLRVAGSTSAFSFKGKAVPIPEIAQQLSVTHIVEGTVRRSGTRVIISAKLINGADGFQVWTSENLEREVKDSLALQDEIAGLIAKGLSLKLGASSPAATAAVNPEAFRLYLEGREAWSRRGARTEEIPETVTSAEVLFERAIKLDPNFARAHAGLAVLWARSYERGLFSRAEDASERAARARTAIERALALDPNLAEAHTARARLLSIERKYAAADAAFQQAIALNPNDATAHHWYGGMLVNRGKLAEGLAEVEIATRLDPLSSIVISNYSSNLRTARRWREALAAAERALNQQPNFGEALGVRVDALIGLARITEARSAFQATINPANPGRFSIADQVVRLVQLGDTAGAAKMAEPILGNPAMATTESALQVFVALNRTEEAFAFFERGGPRLFGRRPLGTFLDPIFDRTRDDPRFSRIVEEAGKLADYREAWAQYQAWKTHTGEP